MTYIPSTHIKYVKASTTAAALGFDTHLWDYLSNQDGEFCRKNTATYNNTRLKGLFFSNWFFDCIGTSLDYQFACIYNTIGENIAISSYTGNATYKASFLGGMDQYGLGLCYFWSSTVVHVGVPIYGVNLSRARNTAGSTRNTSRHLSSHIFMLPIAENK